MFTVTGSESAADLSAGQLWSALLEKASDPVPFVPAITACRVVERGPGYLVRDIVLRGESVRELVTFDTGRRVLFERVLGSAMGTIENRIEGDEEHGLWLRFTFHLEVDGLADGSPEERAFKLRMRNSYLTAVRTTLQRARLLALQEAGAA